MTEATCPTCGHETENGEWLHRFVTTSAMRGSTCPIRCPECQSDVRPTGWLS